MLSHDGIIRESPLLQVFPSCKNCPQDRFLQFTPCGAHFVRGSATAVAAWGLCPQDPCEPFEKGSSENFIF